jgi:hypothetical protein
MRAFDLAERVGWSHVSRTLHEYGVIAPAQLDSPERSFQAIRDGVVRDAALVSEIMQRPVVAGVPSIESHRGQGL